MHIGAKAFQGIEVCEKHPVLSEYGVNLKSTVLFDSYHVCISALSNSNFWALIPDWVISKQKNKLQAIPVPKNWDAPFEVCFVYDNRFQDSRVFDSLVSALKKYMSTH